MKLPDVDPLELQILAAAVGSCSLWLYGAAIGACALLRISGHWASATPDIIKHRQATKQTAEREKTKRLAVEHETERFRIAAVLALSARDGVQLLGDLDCLGVLGQRPDGQRRPGAP